MALRKFEGNQGGSESDLRSQKQLLGSLWDLVSDMTNGDQSTLIGPTNRLIAASYIIGSETNFELLAHISPTINELEQAEDEAAEEVEKHEGVIKITGEPIKITECSDADDYTKRIKSGVFRVTSGAKEVKILFDDDELDIHVAEINEHHKTHKLNIFSEYYQGEGLSPELIDIIEKGFAATRRARRFHNILAQKTPNNADLS